ncbi:hypothetical protein EPUL_004710, partial [Erysiphe pulchra]
MHQPRHVFQALADFPSTFESVVTTKPFRIASTIIKKKNYKRIVSYCKNQKMPRPLPPIRGPPPTGPSAMKSSAPTGPSAMKGSPPIGPSALQNRGVRRPPGTSTSGSSQGPHKFLSRSESDSSIYRDNRQFPSKQNNTKDDTYRARNDSGSHLARSERYYPDSYQDQLRRFESKINDRENDVRRFSNYDLDLSSNFRGEKFRFDDGKNDRRHVRERQPNRARRGYGRFSRVASEREFLRTKREPTPQLMTGMNEESGCTVKFLRLEDLSDSEEADMDLSGNEDAGFEKKKSYSASNSPNDSVPFDTEPGESSTRTFTDKDQGDTLSRIETGSPSNEQDEKKKSTKVLVGKKNNIKPRWSNPDPYTALPPPDESQRKKKDVVKLIRKARVASESKTKLETPTDDFISFDSGENEIVDLTSSLSPPKTSRATNSDENLSRSRMNRDTSPMSRNFRRSTSPLDTKKDKVINYRGKSPNRISAKDYSANDLVSDSNLGSRKRTISDVIKEPPITSEKGVRSTPDGRILNDWLPYDDISESPWLIDHSNISNMYKRLHEEILDFYHFVKPRRFEQYVREKLIEDLRRRIRNYSQEAEIFSFGSFPAGLYLPTADLDLVMISNHYMQGGRPQFGYNASQVYKFGRFLDEEQVILKGSKECITKAKVPLVKYVDRLTGLKVDISFENTNGLVANKTFQAWKEKFPAMPIIVTLIKQFLFMRGLDQPVNGGIGGFSITCLVVSLLQHMPQTRSRPIIPEHNLGEVLLEFFDLYGNKFDTVKHAISVNPACYLSKCDLNQAYKKRLDKFCIIDPNNPDNDIAGGSRNSMAIKRAFQFAYEDLRQRMIELQKKLDNNKRRPQSILSCIIGGNYSSFNLQREHL